MGRPRILSDEERKEYILNWKREARRKRGLQKQGRKPLSEEEKEVSKETRRLYMLEWNKTHPWNSKNKVSRLLWAARKRAKSQNLPFDITEDDIQIPTHCPYLGIELCNSSPRGSARNNVASLDKIVPELGYVKGNVEVISHQANTMKNDASKEELVQFAHEILKRYT